MPKFFVTTNQINNDEIIIQGEDVNHIANVLRKQIRDELNICNITTSDNFLCQISEISKQSIKCKIINTIPSKTEPKTEITIFQGLPKAEKMELIIQKCTELGVNEITPVQMERCVVKLDSKSENKKIERWQKIAEAAAKQSRQNNICKINNVTNIKNICNFIKEYDILLVPYENEENNSFKKEVEKIIYEGNERGLKIAIVIGPEGGFEKKEIELLKQNGGKIITLGTRILRTETVAIAMVSSIMYQFGELG